MVCVTKEFCRERDHPEGRLLKVFCISFSRETLNPKLNTLNTPFLGLSLSLSLSLSLKWTETSFYMRRRARETTPLASLRFDKRCVSLSLSRALFNSLFSSNSFFSRADDDSDDDAF